jgi:hypothetical protein
VCLLASGYSPSEVDPNQLNQLTDIFSSKSKVAAQTLLDQKIIEDRSLILILQKFQIHSPEAISAGDQFNITLQRVFWNSL